MKETKGTLEKVIASREVWDLSEWLVSAKMRPRVAEADAEGAAMAEFARLLTRAIESVKVRPSRGIPVLGGLVLDEATLRALAHMRLAMGELGVSWEAFLTEATRQACAADRSLYGCDGSSRCRCAACALCCAVLGGRVDHA